MRKLNDVLEQSSEDLPLFLDSNNLLLKNIENIDIIDIYQFKNTDTLSSIIFHFYGGYTEQEQFVVTKIILPLFLMFNEIFKIENINTGKYLKIPEQYSLLNSAYYFDELETTIENSLSFDNEKIINLPGINNINKYNNKKDSGVKNNTINIGIPSLQLKQEKVTFDSNTGIIYY